MQELMEQMDISDKTLHRMIEEGDLPDFSYGSKWTKKKGWHAAVLERHAMEKYEQSRSIQNVSHSLQVARENVAVDLLSDGDAVVTEQEGNLNDGLALQQKRSRKVMPKGVRSSTVQSRVAAGF